MVGRRLVPELHRRGPLAPPDRPRHALAARPARADGRVRRPGAGQRRGPAVGPLPAAGGGSAAEGLPGRALRVLRSAGAGAGSEHRCPRSRLQAPAVHRPQGRVPVRRSPHRRVPAWRQDVLHDPLLRCGEPGLLCTAIALLIPRPAVPEERALVIVVHPERAAALGIEDVARIYLRKARFWGDGTPIVALNREPARTCSEYVTRAADSARSIAPEKGAALTEPFYRNPP